MTREELPMRQLRLDCVLETRDPGIVPEAEINARQEQLGSAWAILNNPRCGGQATSRRGFTLTGR